MKVSIRDLMTDAGLFGSIFAGESWEAWRALLSAFYGLELDEDEQALFEAVTGLSEPLERECYELWLAIGRRGGKSQIAALLTVFEAAFKDHRDKLAPGEVATVLCISADRRQSRTVMRYVSGLLHSNPMLKRMITRETGESIELANKAAIEVGTASFRAVRGYTLAAVVCDEVAFWRNEESANPDKEILNALRPALATLDGKVIALSSPYARRGELWNVYRNHYGKPGSILVAQAPSRTMNPSLPARIVEEALQRDESAARAEYMGEFRNDLEQYTSIEQIRACIEPGCIERPHIPSLRYFGFVDPSGGSQDSMTLGIAHQDKAGIAILDLVREVKPPFSPEQVVIDFCHTLKDYRVRSVHGDRYAGEWVVESFQKRGIRYKRTERSKSEIYRDLLPLLNSQQCELLDIDRLSLQLQGLERRTARGGRDSIDHAPGGHDDLVNAAAGALVHATILNRELSPKSWKHLPRMV